MGVPSGKTSCGIATELCAWIALLGAAACSPPSSPNVDSATHWLSACETAADCGEDLQCLCGMCTRACAQDDECELGTSACVTTQTGTVKVACDAFVGSAPPAQICAPLCEPVACAPDEACSREICLEGAPPFTVEQTDVPLTDDGALPLEQLPDGAIVSVGEAGIAAASGPSSQRIIDAALGTSFSCALADDQRVYCWGVNDEGQLGLGDTEARGDDPGEAGASFVGVDLGMGRVVRLAAGDAHVCALDELGQIKCWGANGAGQLGLGDTDARGDDPGEMQALPFVDLGAGVRATELALGARHTCARVVPGPSIKCWGDASDGQLGLEDIESRGDGTGEMGDALPVVDLGTGRTVNAIAAMSRSTCAILDDDTLRCWGANNLGQLGLGDTDPRGGGPGQMGDGLPAVDTGRSGLFRISGGANHVCIVYTDFEMTCFGANDSGQLGVGDVLARGDEARDMGSALGVLALPAGVSAATPFLGRSHTCAGFDDQQVRCWGSSFAGQLGTGSTEDYGNDPGETPAALPGIATSSVRTLSEARSGASHVCLLYADGALACFGDNTSGQLGIGDTEARGDQPGELDDALPFVFAP